LSINGVEALFDFLGLPKENPKEGFFKILNDKKKINI
jgi:hypothetical protein